MGKKRKANGQPFGEPKAKISKDESLIVNSYKDVADSGDEFDLARDKILIDETPAQKQRRKLQEQDEFFELSDEEVFAHSSDETETDEYEDEAVNEIEAGLENQKESPSNSRASKKHAGKRHDEDSDASKHSDEDEHAGGWGASKTDYYNADQIETEADALEEEAEAIRLQKKQLQKMTEADFGFDETEWLDPSDDGNGESTGRGGIVCEVLPQLEIADNVGPEERTKILHARYPEFQHLAQEYIALQATHKELEAKVLEEKSVQGYSNGQALDASEKNTKPDGVSVIKLKHNTLSAYLGAICMYLALMIAPQQSESGKPKAMSPNELHDHPIMETLLSCRNSWGVIKGLATPDPAEIIHDQVSLQKGNGTLSTALDSEAVPSSKPMVKEQRKSKAQKKAQKAYDAAVAKARVDRAARIQQAEEDLKKFDLESSKILKSSHHAPQKSDDLEISSEEDSDFGEETHLNEYDAQEKAKRKKTLQFYSSQIAQKVNKRDAASRHAGGDDDIPYKERLKDRQERLNREAELRGKKGRDMTALTVGMGDSSGDENPAENQSKQTKIGDDDDYDQIISRPAALKAARKAEKTAAYQAKLAAEAEANGDRVVAVEQIGPDGKRAIGYTIEKNKGLAPHRKKDVRNPRVKKRKKFEEKKKKQRNMRPVWKGGEGRGGYGGELTGIKTGIIRGIKL